MPLDPRRVKELFNASLDLTDPDDRTAFLDRECGGDHELRARLGVLLAAYDRPAEALAKLRQAVQLDRTAHGYTQIAMVYAKRAQWAEALQALEAGDFGEVAVELEHFPGLYHLVAAADDRQGLAGVAAEEDFLLIEGLDGAVFGDELDRAFAEGGREFADLGHRQRPQVDPVRSRVRRPGGDDQGQAGHRMRGGVVEEFDRRRVGLPDPGYFARVFRQSNGVSPRDWRRSEVRQAT